MDKKEGYADQFTSWRADCIVLPKSEIDAELVRIHREECKEKGYPISGRVSFATYGRVHTLCRASMIQTIRVISQAMYGKL